MDLGIAGRKAIVCASSRGLGRACAQALAEAGCEVIINGLDAARQLAAWDWGPQPILITMHADDRYVLEALRAGVRRRLPLRGRGQHHHVDHRHHLDFDHDHLVDDHHHPRPAGHPVLHHALARRGVPGCRHLRVPEAGRV